MDEKRLHCKHFEKSFQQVQRNQFEAEKKVAIADTSIQNLQRAIQQIEEEKRKEISSVSNLADELFLKEKELNIKRTDLDQLQKHQEYTKDQILQTQAFLKN